MGNYRYIFVGIGIIVSFNSFSMAGDVWWDACNGNWSDTANWSPKIPTSNDTVYIDNGCGGPSIGKGDSFARTLYVGMDTKGNALNQTNSLPNSLTVNNMLYLGWAEGSEGKYTLSSPGRLTVGSEMWVGIYGNGTFKQTGGNTTINSSLFLGPWSLGTVGIYEMSGGEVTATNIYVGSNDSTGIFRHSAGKVTVTKGGMQIAGIGTRYELSGTGELARNSGCLIYGMSADKPNRFIQSGGKHSSTAGLSIMAHGVHPDGAANYTLTAGTFSITSGIGLSGPNISFIQSGGTNTVTNDIQIINEAKYELSGIGSVSMNNLQLNGNFIQTGGTNHLSGNLYLDPISSCWHDESGADVYTLEGGELSVGGFETIAGYDAANPCPASISTFIQKGGIHRVNTFLYVGYDPVVTGKYDMSDGELEANILWVGYRGNGKFTQTGGTTSTGRLDIGRDQGSIGEYILDHSGHLVVDRLTVGRSGEGTMNLLKGGKLAAKIFGVGRYSGPGALSLVPGTEVIVEQELSFGSKGVFGAEPGSRILMGFDTGTNTPANFLNLSQNPFDLSGLANLDLSFKGGVEQAATVEIAGGDAGADEMGFWGNFALGILRIGTDTSVGHVKLVDDTDNGTGGPGSEVLYVDRIVLSQGSILDVNGRKVYYHTLCNNGGTINLNGGSLVQVGIPGDLDHNGTVDINDLKGLIAKWLWKGLEGSIPEDLACGGDVNLLDFAVIGSHWMEE
jgi:hypothetical protein